MFIQTEETPNPETLKFLPGCVVMVDGTASYLVGQPCDNSPLASHLLTVDGVVGVFFGSDFVTITKDPAHEWSLLKPSILATLMDHFVSGQPAVIESLSENKTTDDIDDISDPLILQIRELLDTRIRPAVAQDGGDIVFHSFEDGVVYLKMQGACSGCPSSTATLKSGIENMLRHYVPEVEEVRAI